MTTTAEQNTNDANKRQRLCTAAALLPWLPLAIWLHKDMVLVTLLWWVVLVAAHEWLTLSACPQHRGRYLAVTGAVSFILIGWPDAPPVTVLMDVLIGAGVLWWLFVPLLLWWRWPTQPTRKAAMVFPTLLPAYAALVVLALPANRDGAILFMHLLFLVWAADGAAWWSGNRWGRTKLAPAISPGKTWEGVFGALAAVIAVCFVTAWWLGWGIKASLVLFLCSMLVLVGSIGGDLLESRLKRSAGVKDSGTILPGHGGILDRIDSLTAAAPLFAACIRLGWLG